MKRPDVAHQRTFNPRCLPVVDVVVDPTIAKHLRPHQVQGIKFMYECVMGMRADGSTGQGAILADEMGLGKTLQTIALIHTLLKQSPYWTPISSAIQKALVVCPLTLVKNWKREFSKWVGTTPTSSLRVLSVDGSSPAHRQAKTFLSTSSYDVMIIGYEKLRTCMDQLQHARPPIDLIVCDEGHRLKSRDAKTTKMFEQLPTPRRIILSGTPIQNDLSEFYAMVDFVNPGLLGHYAQFKKVFEDRILRSRMQGATPKEQQEGRERNEILRRATMDIILHRSADLLADYLPSRTDLVVFVAPTPVQLQVYQSMVGVALSRSSAIASGAGMGNPSNPLVLIGLLRKMCDSTRLAAETEGDASACFFSDEARELLTRPVPLEETSGKLVALLALVEQIWTDTPNDKVVIVSNFTSALDVIAQLLTERKYPVSRLDGKTRPEERQHLVNTFNRLPRSAAHSAAHPALTYTLTNGKSFVFLLSAKSGGTGLNLIGANRLILFDSDWNPSSDKQAMARIHRDGQTKPCFIYRLLLAGTIDEKIYQRQLSKLGLSESLLHRTPTSGSTTDSELGPDGRAETTGKKAVHASDAFSPEELRDIFTLHTGTSCVTHDQLQCPCGGEGIVLPPPTSSLEDTTESDDNEVDMDRGFVPASQHATQQVRVVRFHFSLSLSSRPYREPSSPWIDR